jgi:hypothetical protein
MDDSIDMRDSAVTRIIDGSITIDSLSEFENLLNIFPDNPRLHRVFADFLAQEKSFDAVDLSGVSPSRPIRRNRNSIQTFIKAVPKRFRCSVFLPGWHLSNLSLL